MDCTWCVPVAQLDKASDYESEDWGFKSLQGYVLVLSVSRKKLFARSLLDAGGSLPGCPRGLRGQT